MGDLTSTGATILHIPVNILPLWDLASSSRDPHPLLWALVFSSSLLHLNKWVLVHNNHHTLCRLVEYLFATCYCVQINLCLYYI